MIELGSAAYVDCLACRSTILDSAITIAPRRGQRTGRAQ